MIRLRLLGMLDLRDAEGVELSAVTAQPKRLALLAYLAAAAPHRYHRRDSLLALFWPELDDRHARAGLRRALYVLRRGLGATAIVTRGDELGTSRDALWCDAAAFRDALDAGRLREALEFYRGDLLEGFFVPSAPEFERWVETERSQLRAQAAAAAWTLSERAERDGDAREAVRLARIAAAWAADDEATQRRLIALLDRAGDAAAALQVYEGLARRLKDHLELDPSAETRALIESIRARQAPRAAPPPGTAPALLPNLIAVLPFTVRGDDALRYLREGLVDLLSAKLDRAGDVGTVDPRALIRYVQSLGVSEIDPELGRRVAMHFNAGLFLLGSVVAAGGQLHLSASIYETEGSRETRAERTADGEVGLLPAVDQLVRRLLVHRMTSFGGRMARMAGVTTESLPALKAYLLGERAFRGGRYADALAAYDLAVREDSGFALGHYRLAATYAACGLPERARAPSALAREHRQRLNAHTQLLLEAQAAWLAGDAAAAEGFYARIVAACPDDVEAWFLLGDVAFTCNPYRGRSVGAARTSLERTLALDPRHLGALSHLFALAALERRADERGALFERLRACGPTQHTLRLELIHAAAGGEPDLPQRARDDLRRADPVTQAAIIADVALYARHSHAAERLLRVPELSAASPALGALARLTLAHLAAARRDWPAARRELDAAAAVDGAAALEHRAFLLALPLLDVDPAERDATVQALAAWQPAPTPAAAADRPPALAAHDGLHAHLRSYLLGLLAARSGAADEARCHADACQAHDAPADQAWLPAVLARGVRARVAYAAGDPSGALELLGAPPADCPFRQAAVSPFHALAAERFLRGEALTMLGRRDEAAGWLEGLGQRSPFELVFKNRARELLAGC